MEHGQESQLNLPAVLAVPQLAIDLLRAVRKEFHERPDLTKGLRDAELAPLMGVSGRTWSRYKKDLQGKTNKPEYGGRDWLEIWPITREWKPSWEPLLDQPGLQPGERRLVSATHFIDPIHPERSIVAQLVWIIDTAGDVVKVTVLDTPVDLKRALGHLGALAAVLFGYTLLDLSNGHFSSMPDYLDGPLQMHSILLAVIAECHRWLA